MDVRYLFLASDSFSFPELFLSVFFLLPKIRVFFYLGLVQAIDNDILALFNVNTFDQLVVLETHLAGSHSS